MRLCIMGMVLTLAACGQSTSTNTDGNAPSRQKERASSTNAGARALKAEFKKYFTNCDGVWVAKANTTYYEYANLEFLVTEQDLTAADEMNGLTFKGHVTFGEKMTYREQSTKYSKAGTWKMLDADDYFNSYHQTYRYPIIKKDGAWVFDQAYPPTEYIIGSMHDILDSLQPADCSERPFASTN